MLNEQQLIQLRSHIDTWAAELGFQGVGVCDTNLSKEKPRFEQWLSKEYHGEMKWLSENTEKRFEPAQLVPETCRILSLRMNYLPQDTQQIKILKSPNKAYISRYALGRDYHKLIRKRLAKLAKKIEEFAQDNYHQTKGDTLYKQSEVSQRPFVDSAPVLERPIAEKAGLGWVGKHTLVLNREAGSWFFLGELFTNIPIPINTVHVNNHCGDCEACLKVCPTDAFPKPYELDARRCISYLTIENKGSIPEEYREVMGNRVFGCDDCQAICPWNKYAKFTDENDFTPRHDLADIELLDLFKWDEKTFLERTQGSPIRRIGYEAWRRNLSVGLGNAEKSENITLELKRALNSASPMLSEHFQWALDKQLNPNKRRQRKLKRHA